MITQERLKELLSYDPKTGIFVWLKCKLTNRNGTEAGGINPRGYQLIWADNKSYRAHRLAWLYVYAAFPNKDIDHIDGDRSNNAICNLRCVTPTENQTNRKLNANNKSGVPGVRFRKDKRVWISRIKKHGKDIYLGSFKNRHKAVEARNNAELELNFHPNHGRIEMKMQEKIDKTIDHMRHVMLTQGRDWFSPTEIGREVGGIDKHSSYGSPICKKMVSLGIAERNDKGSYRLADTAHATTTGE